MSFKKWCGSVILILALIFSLSAAGDAPVAADTVKIEAGPAAVVEVKGIGDCHTQGITLAGGDLFVSCVDKKNRRGLVYRFDLPSGFPTDADKLSAPSSKDVTSDTMYHPSGLDHDDGCVWVAAANYRSFMARAHVACLNPANLEEKSSFIVDDHIGALAAMGDEIVGLNWGAKDFYRFDKKGKLLGKDPSPTGLAYQDCQGLSANSILCSGSVKQGGAWSAAVDTLVFDPTVSPHWRATRRTLISVPFLNLGREAFAADDGTWLFLPRDFPGAKIYAFTSIPK